MKYVRTFFVFLSLLVGGPAVAQWQVPDHSVPIGRGGGTQGFKNATPAAAGYLLGSTGATTDPVFMGFLPAGGGATVRTWQDKLRDVVALGDFGGVAGGSATTNTTAFNAALAYAKPFLVPPGNYQLTTSDVAPAGRWSGYGQIVRADGTAHAPNYLASLSPPSSQCDTSGPGTAFTCDVRNTNATEHWIMGTATLGQPATGYVNVPNTAAEYLYTYNSSGWNQGTATNVGRTGAHGHWWSGFQAGQGDLTGWGYSCIVVSAKAGATSPLAQPGCSALAGTTFAGINGAALTGIGDINLQDQGYDATGIAHNINLTRTGPNTMGNFWFGYSVQAGLSTVPVDAAFRMSGNFRVGFDAVDSAGLGNVAAIAMGGTQRQYLNSTNSDPNKLPNNISLGNVWLEYNAGISAINFVNGGSILQLYSDHIAATQPMMLAGVSSPAAPPSGYAYVYAKTDTNLYTKLPSGVESQIITSAAYGTGIGTFLATPSSANLRAALTDETGTGPAVFGTGPTLDGATLATKLNKGVYTLAQSGAAVSVTGTTSLTTLATIAVPANVMGTNGRLRITTLWSTTNSANNKTLSITFGGASYMGVFVTTNASVKDQRDITNRNAANSQVGWNASTQGGGWGASSGAVATSAVDTTTTQNILIQGQLVNTGETITLESYSVELILP